MMAILKMIDEMKQKDTVEQFEFWQIEHVDDIDAIREQLGSEFIAEAINIGLRQLARKRRRTNKDPRLTSAQLLHIQRMSDLVLLQAMTRDDAIKVLLNKGLPLELIEENLKKLEEE